jgi:hypothetical protein
MYTGVYEQATSNNVYGSGGKDGIPVIQVVNNVKRPTDLEISPRPESNLHCSLSLQD